MIRRLMGMSAVVALGLLAAWPAGARETAATAKKSITVASAEVKKGQPINDEQVFNGFGCTGKNISPSLNWAGAPAGTKSFAVTVYDPDAPTGSGFWHWVVFNIPASAKGLPKNAGDLKANLMPAGAVQSRTDFGVPGWGGPCPPKGDKPHHYIFTVYAVDTDKLDGDQNISAAVVGFMLNFHTLAKGTLTGTYGR